MNWVIKYLPEVEKDWKALSGSQVIAVRKALEKVRQNPLPQEEGGYGKRTQRKLKSHRISEDQAQKRRDPRRLSGHAD